MQIVREGRIKVLTERLVLTYAERSLGSAAVVSLSAASRRVQAVRRCRRLAFVYPALWQVAQPEGCKSLKYKLFMSE